MTRRKKRWVHSPSKALKPKVPEDVKRGLEEQAAELIEAVLKPKYVEPPPEDARFNYIVDIHTKWYQSYFYFCSKYHCPGPTAISPYFEDKFARLEYVGEGRFNVSFMRHTDKWEEIYAGLTAEESLAAVQDDPWFQP